MTERCDYSDLPRHACDHCAHGIPSGTRIKGRMIARTEAQYDGKCPACGESISPGDPIAFILVAADGFWVHEGCA